MVIDPSEFFQCRMCGDCCKGYGGTTVTQEDIRVISEYLRIKPERFLTRYCERSGARTLIKQGQSGYCVFWDGLCTIHPVKPRMCRLWPFIESVLIDPSNWTAMHSMCPGIRQDADPDRLAACVRQVLADYEATVKFPTGKGIGS